MSALLLSQSQQRRANQWLCGIHASLAVASLVAPGFTLFLGTPEPVWCEGGGGSGSGGSVCQGACSPRLTSDGLCTAIDYATPVVGSLYIPTLCFSFFAVTAAAHWYYYEHAAEYYAMVQRQNMWWRWAEYALSVPPMLLIIVGLNGYTLDIVLLQSAALGSATQFFGLAADHELAEGVPSGARWAHALGYVPITFALLPVLVALRDISSAPSFVPFLVVSQLLFFMSFGLVQAWLLFYDAPTPRRYAIADTVYLLLSLACKTSLAGSVLAASALLA